MTNRKSILALLVLVVLLAAANAFFRYGVVETKALGRQTLVEDADGVNRIVLERKGRADVSLARSGSNWRLVLPYAGSADARVVAKFVDVLSMTPIADVIGESALLKLGRTRGDLSLDEPVLSVVLGFENGESERLDFGSKTPLTNGVFVSIGEMDSVFVVSASVLETVDVDAQRDEGGDKVVDGTGEDAAEDDPEKRGGAELGSHNGATDGTNACNVQELDEEDAPRLHGNVVHAVSHRYGRGDAVGVDFHKSFGDLGIDEVSQEQQYDGNDEGYHGVKR